MSRVPYSSMLRRCGTPLTPVAAGWFYLGGGLLVFAPSGVLM